MNAADAAADAGKALEAAYHEYNSEARATGTKIAFILVVILLPFGASLDYFDYPAHRAFFLLLRLVCAAVAFAFWLLMRTRFGRSNFRFFVMTGFILPSLFIDLMIYFSDGAHSSYYGGLNLLLIGYSWVAQIDFVEALSASVLTLVMYGAACLAHGGGSASDYFSSYFFLTLNGVIVSTGCYYLNNLRFREFESRSKLDDSRRELEQTNAKLVELDRAKSNFFANVSHELRTPLTLLIGPLDRLRQRDPAPTAAERVELLDIMHNNSLRLLRLINDLLDLVRLDSGAFRMRREKVELLPFLDGIARSVVPMADQRKLRFETCFDPQCQATVWIDRDKLEKITLNLLFNSFKFTPELGTVTLGASLENECLILRVRDTGKGIDPVDLPRIFDRFWQAEAAATRHYQGVGIGLALVKEFAEKHGGSVFAASELGKGTEMTVKIDARSPAEAEAEAEIEENASKSKPDLSHSDSEWLTRLYRRAELFPSHVFGGEAAANPSSEAGDGKPAVLVADDEPEMRRFLTSQLKAAYSIFEARNGSEALELAQTRDFTLILLDLMMPGIDGITLTGLLREEPRTKHVPIIMLTARADEASKLHALKSGVTDFLTKPFSSSELAVRCHNSILQQQLQQGLAAKSRDLEAALEQIKQTEAQMVHQAKMASLGQLSSGLMHEINNPLNFANTAAHLLQKRLGKVAIQEREPIEKPLRDLQDGIRRAADIVGRLRSFTHPDVSTYSAANLKEIVQTAARFVQAEVSEVRVEIAIADDLAVWGNANELVHLFINLLQNACDSLREKNAPEKKISVSTALQNGRVVVECEDNGKGINAEECEKVFEAFFTTKPVGAGVGLGLYISHRIVQNHRGEIRVESKENEYCRFIITLNQYDQLLRLP